MHCEEVTEFLVRQERMEGIFSPTRWSCTELKVFVLKSRPTFSFGRFKSPGTWSEDTGRPSGVPCGMPRIPASDSRSIVPPLYQTLAPLGLLREQVAALKPRTAALLCWVPRGQVSSKPSKQQSFNLVFLSLLLWRRHSHMNAWLRVAMKKIQRCSFIIYTSSLSADRLLFAILFFFSLQKKRCLCVGMKRHLDVPFISRPSSVVETESESKREEREVFVTQMLIKVNILCGATFLLHYVSRPTALGNFWDQFRSAD